MITLFTTETHNGQRANIAAAESGLPYVVKYVDLQKKEQRDPAFLAVNPAGRVPVLLDEGDNDVVSVSQSGAIIMYLANKSGGLWPRGEQDKVPAMQWLMHACSDCAIWHGVLNQAMNNMWPGPTSEENLEFFRAQRLLRYLWEADAQLRNRDYLAGDYSLADIALYPVVAHRSQIVEGAGFTNLSKWRERVGARSAVQKGMRESSRPMPANA